jgi:uncharacterized protein YuzE
LHRFQERLYVLEVRHVLHPRVREFLHVRQGQGAEVKATYDHEADAAYVYLREDLEPSGRLKTVEVTNSILLDYIPAEDEHDIDVWYGIELLAPKPRPRLAKALASKGLAHLLDDIYAVLDMATGTTTSGRCKLTTSSAWLP